MCVCRLLWWLSVFFKEKQKKNKKPVCQRKFGPWVRKIPWRREWQPTPVFLPGESRGQRSLVAFSPRRSQKSQVWLREKTIATYVFAVFLQLVFWVYLCRTFALLMFCWSFPLWSQGFMLCIETCCLKFFCLKFFKSSFYFHLSVLRVWSF